MFWIQKYFFSPKGKLKQSFLTHLGFISSAFVNQLLPVVNKFLLCLCIIKHNKHHLPPGPAMDGWLLLPVPLFPEYTLWNIQRNCFFSRRTPSSGTSTMFPRPLNETDSHSTTDPPNYSNLSRCFSSCLLLVLLQCLRT